MFMVIYHGHVTWAVIVPNIITFDWQKLNKSHSYNIIYLADQIPMMCAFMYHVQIFRTNKLIMN